MAHVVEHLPNFCKALDSIPTTAKKKKKVIIKLMVLKAVAIGHPCKVQRTSSKRDILKFSFAIW
jgi:hypothetical protein